MNNSYINEIVAAIKACLPLAKEANITPDLHFYEIPGMDSMTIVNFQMKLTALIGDKAKEVQPIMDMTIAEYAQVLESV